MFDKAKYRKRRKAGLRGQEGVYLPPGRGFVVRRYCGPDWPKKPVSVKAIKKQTKRARKAGVEQWTLGS